ncbi:MAG: NAD(P)/FAD-dependent oxidoreductase, partial [Bacteroidales bacterium]|nr:NAD(P)/FAD-dependent oxidoreductase [Bacteroidales bacterium]
MVKTVQLKRDKVKTNYSGDKQYDLVIIGSGLSGLSSGLMWQQNTEGKRTLIIEKNSYPGGYSTAYERDGYVFETTQLFPDIVDILEYLEIDINLKQYEGNFMRRLVVEGDQVDEYKIPTGAENFKDYLVATFPDDADKIRSLMDYSVDMFKQVRKLKANATLKDKLKIPFQAPKVVANLNRTYAGLLDKFGITNPKLREVMETFTSFSGVPSDRASSIMATGAMLSSMTRCFRPYGFFDEFPAKMSQLFQERGGEMRFDAEVEKIIVENGEAKGVRVKGDEEIIRAGTIITTVDPMLAMRKLVGDEHLPASYVEKLKNTIMSVSSLNVALG